MSSTRTKRVGTPMRQERWASSLAFNQSLKANLVARRCSVLASREDRELVWQLQYESMKPGGLRNVGARFNQEGIIHEDFLKQLCLDPESDLFTYAARLRDYFKRTAPNTHAVVTEIGRKIEDALAYCSETRGMVLITGRARTGKTYAAQRYCEQHPGRARYVQVPSSGDDLSFYAAIGRALGIVIERDAKAKYLKPRIEAVLQTGDLALVMDGAEWLWPTFDYRRARPSRICWIMTALVNNQVPVALIGTEQFFNAQIEHTKKTGWNDHQFIGRCERFVQLPDKLSLPDLQSVARAWLPNGKPEFFEALAHYANLSVKHVAAVEHLAKRAQYLAKESGREVEWSDVRAAITESPLPTDTAVAGLIARSGVKERTREALEARPRPRREALADAPVTDF